MSHDVDVIVCIWPFGCEGIGDVTRDATRSDDASAPGAVLGRGRGAEASTESARVITSQAGAKAAAENFPVALRLLPGRHRS